MSEEFEREILDKEIEDDNSLENEKIEYDNKELKAVDKLERKKQETKKYYAENNHANTQSFIQEAQTVNYYINNMIPEKYKLSVDRQFDLCNTKECITFVTEFKNTDYFIVAFILSMFEKVDVFDVKELKSLLVTCLPDFKEAEIQDSVRKSEYIGPYVAQDSILSVIKGEKYIQNERRYWGFGNVRRTILKNFMEQFSDLQVILLEMIELLLRTKRFRTDFYLFQIGVLLNDLWADCMIDVEHKFLPSLCKNDVNLDLLGISFYLLYLNQNTRAGVINIFDKWLKGDNRWLWKVPCLVYLQLEEREGRDYFEERLEKAVEYKLTFYHRRDYQFIAELLMASKDFCNLVCKVMNNIYLKREESDRKLELAQAYLYLVERCYYKVHENNMNLPLIVCDTKYQLIQLQGIFEIILDDYYLRQQLFYLLKAYLKEVSQYHYSKSFIKRMAAFCYFLSIKNMDFKGDIRDMINECPDQIAKQIIETINT